MTEPDERTSPVPAQARRDSVITLIALGITALLYLLSVPWAFAMVVTGPVAVAFAARAFYRSRGVSGVTAFRVWLGMGAVAALFATLMGVTFMIFADVITDLRGCMDRAVTQQAQRACERDYEQDVADTVEGALERLGVTVEQ